MYQGPQPTTSTAMLTVTWLVTSIIGLAYVGLFVLMGVGASGEISTIEELKEMKASGVQVTNTVADLDASIAENELAIVVFFAGAALTLPLVIASFAGVTGRGWVRGVATGFLVVPIVVIIFGVIHDIQDGHEENVVALVLTVPAIVPAILWWLPPTTRAMTARRHKRTPVQQGPLPQTPYGSYR